MRRRCIRNWITIYLLPKSTQQFIDIQNHLGHKDKLNEYITHRASATFIVLPGVKGGYLGETLFD